MYTPTLTLIHSAPPLSHLLDQALWGGAALVELVSVVELVFAAGVGELWDCAWRQVDVAGRREAAAGRRVPTA